MQNVKTGLANIKEILGIMLSDDTSNDGYDFYINSNDAGISETAKLLKSLETQQEEKRFTVSSSKPAKGSTKKKSKPINSKSLTSQNIIRDVPIIDNADLEK